MQLIGQNIISTIEEGSDGVSGQLPDGRIIEINNVEKMLSKISRATSAQAVHARHFYEAVEMSKVHIAVKVITDNFDTATQTCQWFDASEQITIDLQPRKKMKKAE